MIQLRVYIIRIIVASGLLRSLALKQSFTKRMKLIEPEENGGKL